MAQMQWSHAADHKSVHHASCRPVWPAWIHHRTSATTWCATRAVCLLWASALVVYMLTLCQRPQSDRGRPVCAHHNSLLPQQQTILGCCSRPACAPPPRMDNSSQQEAIGCQYSSWYPKYARHAIRSILIPLPSSVEQFLHEDGITLGDDTTALPTRLPPPTEEELDSDDKEEEQACSTANGNGLPSAAGPSSSHPDSSSSSDEEEEEQEPVPWPQRCAEVWPQLVGALQQLGPVAPALNWSSPSDAVWVSSTKNLKCYTPDEVLLLLKSSDRIQHDLALLQQLRAGQPTPASTPVAAAAAAAAACSTVSTSSDAAAAPATANSSAQQSFGQLPAVLVLREWFDLRPECELRCFVHQHKVVAACQRDVSQHFPQLQGQQHQLAAAAVAAHQRFIGDTFTIPSYVVDLYLAPSGAVRLLNFAPICATTSPLLFTWEELPYTQMHGTDTSSPPDGQASSSSSSSSSSGGSTAPHDAPTSHAELPGSSSSHTSTSPQTAVAGSGLPECRLIEQPGLVQVGALAATGMPYDMLHMQDSLEGIIDAMQRQQRGQQ